MHEALDIGAAHRGNRHAAQERFNVPLDAALVDFEGASLFRLPASGQKPPGHRVGKV
jgi:hypothetical protein